MPDNQTSDKQMNSIDNFEKRVAHFGVYIENGAHIERDREHRTIALGGLNDTDKAAVIDAALLRANERAFKNRVKSGEVAVNPHGYEAAFKEMAQALCALPVLERTIILEAMEPAMRSPMALQFELLDREARD